MYDCIGIDEVGRGPVAGPVTVGVFGICSKDLYKKIKAVGLPLRDSKKLTLKQREVWYVHMKQWQKEKLCAYVVVSVPALTIDRIGIAPAIKRALNRGLSELHADFQTLILLDGGLRAPVEFKNQKTIIKGDEKEVAIALASIVAKVTRDQYMTRQAKKYPAYGFERHVGYGTREHYVAIRKHGRTLLHRNSFLTKLK